MLNKQAIMSCTKELSAIGKPLAKSIVDRYNELSSICSSVKKYPIRLNQLDGTSVLYYSFRYKRKYINAFCYGLYLLGKQLFLVSAFPTPHPAFVYPDRNNEKLMNLLLPHFSAAYLVLS